MIFSVCKEDIKILHFIKDVKRLDIQKSIKLTDQWIDVFEASDDYFNDICNENTNDRDIKIKNGRKDIYQKVFFVNKVINVIDYDLKAANYIRDLSF